VRCPDLLPNGCQTSKVATGIIFSIFAISVLGSLIVVHLCIAWCKIFTPGMIIINGDSLIVRTAPQQYQLADWILWEYLDNQFYVSIVTD
jgi:hypothetical protein